MIANQDIHQGKTKIFLGSPRDLLTKEVNKLTVLEGATLDYESILYPNLEKLKNLLPDYVTIGGGEQLPGLLLRYLPSTSKEFDINQEIQTVAFDDVYFKNVEIELSGNIEDKIIAFANKYRQDKYKIYEDNLFWRDTLGKQIIFIHFEQCRFSTTTDAGYDLDYLLVTPDF